MYTNGYDPSVLLLRQCQTFSLGDIYLSYSLPFSRINRQTFGFQSLIIRKLKQPYLIEKIVNNENYRLNV